jgi:glycosyltransferase involved in cell wall biosynthesis
LTEELVRLGHQVTLFASADSKTNAELVPMCRNALRTDGGCRDPLTHHVLMLERVLQRASDFDIIHYHCDYLHFPLSRRLKVPHVTTLHGRLDIPDLQPLFDEFSEMPLVSISDSQRAPLPQANFCGTVYHGLPLDLLEWKLTTDDYLVVVGRISPEKRLDRAIEIAKRLQMPLKVGAKVDKADREYFEEEIVHLLDDPLIEFLGEVGESEKNELVANASAFLFPIDWPEPFGLVMIEAMACGTPVIAFRNGSVPEIIDDGVTGFVVNDVDEAVEATRRARTLDRRLCRRTFEERFSVARMTNDYLRLYDRLIERDYPTSVRRSAVRRSAA